MIDKKRINSLIDTGLHHEFKRSCTDQNVSMTVVLERLIQAFLDRNKRKDEGSVK